MDKSSKQRRQILRNLIIQHAPQRKALLLTLRDGTTVKLRNCLTYKLTKLNQEATYRIYWKKQHYGIIKLLYPGSQHLFDTLIINELYGYSLAHQAKLYIPKVLDMGMLEEYGAYYIIYEYLPHQHFSFTDGNLQKLINAQKTLFDAGLVQYDNHVRNYLLTEQGTAIVDFSTIQTNDSGRYHLKMKQYTASIRMLCQACHHLPNRQAKKITCQYYLNQLHGTGYEKKSAVMLTLLAIYGVSTLRNSSQALNRKWPNSLFTGIVTVITRECHTKLCQMVFMICTLIQKRH